MQGMHIRLTHRHASNVAHLALQAAAIGHRTNECEAFAETQINYALGDTGRSYVVGYGTNPPQRAHHRCKIEKVHKKSRSTFV